MGTRNCIVGQSGGPTVAINASLAGVVFAAQEHGYDHIYGMINGIQGLLEDHYMDLKETFSKKEALEQMKNSPAMYLGSCRYKLPKLEEGKDTYEKLFQKFEEMEITDFFYIGGNDSMDTVDKLSAYAAAIDSPIRFIGVPKTVDNDLMGTDHTPGFGSAAKYVATSILEVAYDSYIYRQKSVTIVEIMGRDAGWLAASAALARTESSGAPDLIYLPEVPFDKEQFLNDVEDVLKKKNSVIVAVSEGIRDAEGKYLDEDEENGKVDAFGHAIHSGTGKILENLTAERLGCKVRSIELNVLQRAAAHIASKTDIEESFLVGQKAIEAALAGKTAIMMAYRRVSDDPYQIEIDSLNVREVANLEHKVPLEWINEAHNDVLPPIMTYLRPLIQGEVSLRFKNGIPSYPNVEHLFND